MANAEEQLQQLFRAADVTVDGRRKWDIQIYDQRLLPRVLSGGSLAVGESYMDGWWEARDLEEFLRRMLKVDAEAALGGKRRLAWAWTKARVTNLQSPLRSRSNARHHYDLGNDLYEAMLGPTMAYSCGYWAEAETLDEAQEAKFDLICRKLYLKPGMRLLDIGCGWGSFARYAAQRYKADVTGITLSQEQARFARKLNKGLPVAIKVQDYRALRSRPFDRIVSVGMFEHVGPRNYRTFMETAERLLKDDGLMLLHTIGGNRASRGGDPWMDRYIFPGGVIPSAEGITKAVRGIFTIEDWHNFGPFYAKTLRAWWKNFDAAYPKLDHDRYDERFYRMWKFYLQACAAAFSVRELQLWQIVLSKTGEVSEYRSLR